MPYNSYLISVNIHRVGFRVRGRGIFFKKCLEGKVRLHLRIPPNSKPGEGTLSQKMENLPFQAIWLKIGGSFRPNMHKFNFFSTFNICYFIPNTKKRPTKSFGKFCFFSFLERTDPWVRGAPGFVILHLMIHPSP